MNEAVKKYKNKNEVRCGCLSPSDNDEMSETLSQLLESLNMNSQDILKLRLCVEDVMDIWAQELGEATPCRLLMEQRFLKTTLILQADGKAIDPTQYHDKLMLSVANRPNIASALKLPAVYRYEGGCNELLIRLPTKRRSVSSVKLVLIALAAAVALGLGLRNFAGEFGLLIDSQLIAPLVNTITNLLRLIAGPIVFLSIFSGIAGIGDAASFGKIGAALFKRFFSMILICSALICLSVCWLFPISLGGETGGGGGFLKLLDLILGIIPGDIISPFQSGNALQIIFIAVSMGIGAIILSETVVDTIRIMNQINAIVQLLMAAVSKLLPILIFLSVTDIILTSDIAALSQIIVPLALIAVIDLIFPLLHGIYASVKTKFPLSEMLKAQLPSYLTALTTASSAAAFGANVECCEKKLHIDEKLVHFGVPFGQVLYKVGDLAIYIVTPLYLAAHSEVAITPIWLITLVFVAGILAIATPPIPGGLLSCAVILLSLMGLPAESMAICAAVLTFGDYFATSCNIACLQQELLVAAHKLGLRL